MKHERKIYDAAFKTKAVELSRERSNISELARDKSLKTEFIYGNKLISSKQMQLEIFEYIEIFYNRNRRNSALDYKTIEEFNNQNNFYKLVA